MWFEIHRHKLTNTSKKDMILLKENNIRGGISTVIGDRHVKSDEKQRFCIKMLIICMDGLRVNI